MNYEPITGICGLQAPAPATRNVSYKSNRHVVYSCKYHVVWCPKYRRKVLVNGVDTRLKEIIQQTAVELRAEVIELEIMPNHVHLLVEVDPQFGIHKLVGSG